MARVQKEANPTQGHVKDSYDDGVAVGHHAIEERQGASAVPDLEVAATCHWRIQSSQGTGYEAQVQWEKDTIA